MEANQEKQDNGLSLEERIKELEKVLSEHQHLGVDGSSKFEGGTEFKGKEFLVKGLYSAKDFVPMNIGAVDSSNQQQSRQRVAAFGVAITGQKESVGEQISAAIVAGKKYEIENLPEANKCDYNKVSQSQLRLIHTPQNEVVNSGPSTNLRNSYLIGESTPDFASNGYINTGGNTLEDPEASLQSNKLVGCLISIYTGVGGTLIETHKIIKNTSKIITIDETWAVASGNYYYSVFAPIFLGSAERPFQRGYFSEDIRLGKGSSTGSGVCYIKWGKGSPEGVVTAQPGSLYLNQSGGANGTLFIKESGYGNTGWTPLVTPDYSATPTASDLLKVASFSISKDDIPTGESLGEVSFDVSSHGVKLPAIVAFESWESSGGNPVSRDIWATFSHFTYSGGLIDTVVFNTYNVSGSTATVSIEGRLLASK